MKNKISYANIEPLKDSIVDFRLSFHDGADRTYPVLKQNKGILQPLWVSKRPVIDSCYSVYNPKALIIFWLN